MAVLDEQLLSGGNLNELQIQTPIRQQEQVNLLLLRRVQ